MDKDKNMDKQDREKMEMKSEKKEAWDESKKGMSDAEKMERRDDR